MITIIWDVQWTDYAAIVRCHLSHCPSWYMWHSACIVAEWKHVAPYSIWFKILLLVVGILCKALALYPGAGDPPTLFTAGLRIIYLFPICAVHLAHSHSRRSQKYTVVLQGAASCPSFYSTVLWPECVAAVCLYQCESWQMD